jgi:hypothetical protein
VGHLLRLRITLADRAGALAQAATVIGLHGGNIVSIDVHRTDGPSGVNDLVVDFPHEPDIEGIGHDLAANAAAKLLDEQPMEAGDPVVNGFLMIRKLIHRGQEDGDSSLAEAIARLCHSSAAWVTDEENATRFEAGKQALERTQPSVQRTNDVPPALATESTDDCWLAAVAEVDKSAARRVVFVSRPGHLPFTATEIERVVALLALYGAISTHEQPSQL